MAHVQLIGVVEPKCEDGRTWRFPYGIALVATALSATRHTFNVIDTHLHGKTRDDILRFVETCPAKIYGISAYSDGYHFTKILAQTIRRHHPDAVIIIGGLLARSDEALFDHTCIDIAVTAADGHLVLPRICDALDAGTPLDGIQGLTFRSPLGKTVRTTPLPVLSRAAFRQTDDNPYPLFESEVRGIVNSVNGRDDWPVKGFPLLLSRGCPYECTFCGHMHGRVALRHSWETFFDRAQYLVEKFGAQGFYCYDAVFFYNEKDTEEYCEIYARRGCTFSLVIDLRPTFGTPELYAKLAKHGIRVILYGWESGSNDILGVIRKKTGINKILASARAAADAGIIIYGNFLFGMPGERPETVRDTRLLMSELEKIFDDQREDFRRRQTAFPSTAGYNFSILMALPTSEVFERIMAMNLIKDSDAYLTALDRDVNTYTNLHDRNRHQGADINLSLFSSRQALIRYVRYSINLAKLKALLSRRHMRGEWFLDCGRRARDLVVEYGLYLAVGARDTLRTLAGKGETEEFRRAKLTLARNLTSNSAVEAAYAARTCATPTDDLTTSSATCPTPH